MADATVTPAPPRRSGPPAPPRPAGSLRRTASIDVAWPEGFRGEKILHGRARDLLTPQAGEPVVLAQAAMEARLAFDKTITAISASPAPEGLAGLVGQKGGGKLRVVMEELMPGLAESGAPVRLLLDDISGAALISSWAWSLWDPSWLDELERVIPEEQLAKLTGSPQGVCWGLRPEFPQFGPQNARLRDQPADAGPLVNPADPQGWHAFPDIAGVTMRRARRIDVWRDGPSGLIRIASSFQDSASRPPAADGAPAPRAALHEYRLEATMDPASGRLTSLDPVAQVLPFGQCPGAIANARGLVGVPMAELRERVLASLRGPEGCTHLNDALRALADVPALVAQLAG